MLPDDSIQCALVSSRAGDMKKESTRQLCAALTERQTHIFIPVPRAPVGAKKYVYFLFSVGAPAQAASAP